MKGIIAVLILLQVSLLAHQSMAIDCTTFTVCQDCLYADGLCGWCSTSGTCEAAATTTCLPANFQYTPSAITNSSSSVGSQLSSDMFQVFLRTNQAVTVAVTVTPSTNYPVDLYYLMDFSASMLDDVLKLSSIAAGLTHALQSISSSPRVGFGSFIDKNILPIADTIPSSNPSAAYIFRNSIPLTSDFAAFNASITNLISTSSIIPNWDSPEGGGEALLQVLLCSEQIGWRTNARKIIVYASDADFHMAGDAAMAGIVAPNAGSCQMNANVYDSTFQDYPTAGDLKRAFDSTGVVPIFMVYNNIDTSVNNLLFYNQFVSYLGRGSVGSLSTDSSNAVALFNAAYKVIVNNISPLVVPGPYTSLVSSVSPAAYFNVIPGSSVTFNVTLNWNGVSAPFENQNVQLDFLSFGLVSISANSVYECICPPCDCPNHSTCTCGVCTCNVGFSGSNCTCDLSEGANSTNYVINSPLCSDIGVWYSLCGVCVCPPGFTGVDCSCATSCPNDCNGNGVCNCGVCFCTVFTGIDCSCDPSLCSPGAGVDECFGRGVCNCDTCQCPPGWIGRFCDICDPSSPLNTCQLHDTSCEVFTTCGDCLANSACSWCPTVSTCYEVSAAKTACDNIWNECQIELKILIPSIVGGVIGGIIGLGFIVMAIWKIVIYYKDKREWQLFENQRQVAAFSGSKDAFRSPASEMFNPTFGVKD